MKMIKLEQPSNQHDEPPFRSRDTLVQTNYVQAAPFFLNPRGILAHRVRALYKLDFHQSGRSWWIVEYWCENNANSRDVDAGLDFDPGDRLVCTRCEANAIVHEKKTSSELAGRHCCTGGLRVVNTCCQNEKN